MAELYQLECEYLAESEAALKVSVDGEVLWIPLSVVKTITKRLHKPATVTLEAWFAKKKGLI